MAWAAIEKEDPGNLAKLGCDTTGRRGAVHEFACSLNGADQNLAGGSSAGSDAISSRLTGRREVHPRRREELDRGRARIEWLRLSFGGTWAPYAPHACPRPMSSLASGRGGDGGGDELHVHVLREHWAVTGRN